MYDFKVKIFSKNKIFFFFFHSLCFTMSSFEQIVRITHQYLVVWVGSNFKIHIWNNKALLTGHHVVCMGMPYATVRP